MASQAAPQATNASPGCFMTKPRPSSTPADSTRRMDAAAGTSSTRSTRPASAGSSTKCSAFAVNPTTAVLSDRMAYAAAAVTAAISPAKRRASVKTSAIVAALISTSPVRIATSVSPKSPMIAA